MKLKNYLLACTALVAVPFMTACSEEEGLTNNPQTPGSGDGETGNTIVWPADTIVALNNHYTVPEGKSLIIKEGVQIIVNTEGVGANHVPVEFTVMVTFTVKELQKSLFVSRLQKTNVLKKTL